MKSSHLLGNSFADDDIKALKPVAKFNFSSLNAEKELSNSQSSPHSFTSSSVPASLLGSKVFQKSNQIAGASGNSAAYYKENKLNQTASNNSRPDAKLNIAKRQF